MNLLPASCVQKFLKHTGLAKWAGELILKLSFSKQLKKSGEMKLQRHCYLSCSRINQGVFTSR